jgi:UPF0755 protein
MAEDSTNPNGTARRSRTHQPQKKRKRSSGAKIAGAFLYVLVVIGVSGVLATLGWIWASDLLALNKEEKEAVVTLPEDIFTYTEEVDESGNTETISTVDMDYVVDVLKEKGLIEYEFLFRLFGKVSNAEHKIVAGTYELDTEMDYRALVANMSSSSSVRQVVEVTIPEGYNVDQIFELLEENGVSTVEKLQDMAANYAYKWSFLQDIPLGDYHRLEGYLFPDTYQFYAGEDAKTVLNKLLNGFHSKMKSYYDQFTEDSEYSLHDIVIIASLIEKEASTNDDYSDIASVIYNRLENPSAETVGYLQIDATLVYINGGHVPTEADKSIDSPYNTYLYQGLPAGPISNPGMKSLYAAMNPNKTKYYYYVLNPDTGAHEFSKTYSEHQKLVAKYSDG